MSAPPQLETHRLLLKPVQEEHLPLIAQYLGDVEVRHNMRLEALDTPQKLELWWKKFASWRRQGKVVQWSAFFKDSGDYAALLTIKEIKPEQREGELGYSVLKKHWQQGLASEAAQRVVKYGFDQIHLKKIVAKILPDNIPSQNVVGKMGFTRDEDFRESFFYRDKPYQLWQYSKTNPDFEMH